MKLLFFGLLIVNIAVFGWFGPGPGRLSTSHSGLVVQPPPPGVAGLQLLDERQEGTESVLNPPAGKPGPTVSFLEPYCFSVGPVMAKSSLRELRDLLATRGIRAQARREEFEEFSGHWIFLPPADSRAEARQLVALLTDKGIKDHLIVPSGPKRNAVSLGFFRNSASASDYFARLRDLGFAPVMEENYRSGQRYWLDFSSNESTPIPDAMIRDIDSEYEAEISRSSCEPSG